MKETILLTGATGFLGSYLLRKLLHYKNHTIGNIIVLSRGETQKEAERRVQQALWGHLPLRQRRGLISLLKIVRGDIAQKNLGLSRHIYSRLIKNVTLIYHSAALCEFNIPPPVIRKINVNGTKNLLELALSCKESGQFKCFHHISTIAVAGNKKGIFYEKQLYLGQKFNNTYEQTKFEAEKIIEKYRKKSLPIIVYRPAIITGDTICGYTSNFRMFYQPIHLFCFELVKEIPADRNTQYSLCPVDYVAEAIIRISMDRNSLDNKTYHIANPNYITFGYLINMASRYFNFRQPRFITKQKFSLKKLTFLQFNLIEPYIPYFSYKLRFDTSNAQRILKKTNFKWPRINEQFLRMLFKFCITSGFIKKDDSAT